MELLSQPISFTAASPPKSHRAIGTRIFLIFPFECGARKFHKFHKISTSSYPSTNIRLKLSILMIFFISQETDASNDPLKSSCNNLSTMMFLSIHSHFLKSGSSKSTAIISFIIGNENNKKYEFVMLLPASGKN
jgi:hypothetical protein